jgi:hypothetical protein
MQKAQVRAKSAFEALIAKWPDACTAPWEGPTMHGHVLATGGQSLSLPLASAAKQLETFDLIG